MWPSQDSEGLEAPARLAIWSQDSNGSRDGSSSFRRTRTMLTTSEALTVATRASSRTPRTLAKSDGLWSHETVPMNRWCVTRSDLRNLRRIVREHVDRGLILPTDLDPFDPKDHEIGPSVYTVNEQLIQPVTELAGDCSWALMCHPEGRKCDLFITHCWQEGIYDFINKVLASWPWGASSAYCCMLSNPQNLSIGNLIADPSQSPFALALKSAKWMMVVPNHKVSVFSRTWCTYEAYVAYCWNKTIYTARAPIKGYWWNLLIPFALAFLIACFIFSLVTVYGETEDESVFLPCFGTRMMRRDMLLIWATLFLKRFEIARLMACAGFCLSTLGTIYALKYELWLDGICSVFCVMFFVIVEAERMVWAQVAKQSMQLRVGYSGTVRNAKSTNDNDRRNILAEIHGKERDVDHVVDVLLQLGLSTEHLRTAALQEVDLRAAAAPQYSVFLMLSGHFLLRAAVWEVDIALAVFIVGVFVWMGIYVLSSWEKQAFAASSAYRIFIFLLLLAFVMGNATATGDPPPLTFLIMLPLIILLSALGPARVARVPYLGPILANLFISNSLWCIAGSVCRSHSANPEPVDIPSDSSPTSTESDCIEEV